MQVTSEYISSVEFNKSENSFDWAFINSLIDLRSFWTKRISENSESWVFDLFVTTSSELIFKVPQKGIFIWFCFLFAIIPRQTNSTTSYAPIPVSVSKTYCPFCILVWTFLYFLNQGQYSRTSVGIFETDKLRELIFLGFYVLTITDVASLPIIF
jgi:hypothetical protein